MSEAGAPVLSEVPPPEPTWELHSQLVKLQSYKPEDVVGLPRMGAGLAFADAANQVREVTQIVDELRLDWDRIGPNKRSEIVGQVNAVIANVDAILKMDSSHVDATQEGAPADNADLVRARRDELANGLTNNVAWLVEYARPFCVSAPARRAAEDYIRSEMASLSEEQVNDLQQTFRELKEQAQEFERMRPVVEAQRELLGESGTAKLSSDFEADADKHATAWKRWLAALIVWVVVSAVGGVAFIYATKPPDKATNAQIVSHIFVDLLVIGLALFVVRVLALRFRAHSHMEVVARSKANALSTFNRIVAGQEPEVKTVVAAALAQSVLSTDENVFADSSAEHVTILERVLSPGIDKLRS